MSALVGAGAIQRQEENIMRLQDLVSQRATTPTSGSQDASIPDPPAIVPPPSVIIPPVVSGPSDSDSTATRAEHKQSLVGLTAFMRFDPPIFDEKKKGQIFGYWKQGRL